MDGRQLGVMFQKEGQKKIFPKDSFYFPIFVLSGKREAVADGYLFKIQGVSYMSNEMEKREPVCRMISWPCISTPTPLFWKFYCWAILPSPTWKVWKSASPTMRRNIGSCTLPATICWRRVFKIFYSRWRNERSGIRR